MSENPIDVRLERLPAVIGTERGPILMKDFADFFGLFRIAYAASVEAMATDGDLASEVGPESVDRTVNLVNEHLHSLSAGDIERLNAQTMGLVEPGIVTIRRENPIELIILAIALPLVAAVILSGGEFEMSREGGIKVKLPALGTGITKLKKALRL